MANKIMFGADLIDVLKNKYNMNKLGEVPTKYKNGVTTIDFIYGKEKDIDDLKYNKPYVEFSIDDETDGFISGTMYLNGGVEGVQFDSWEDLKYFMKNAKWTESRKSMKEEIYDIGNYTYPKVVTVDNVDKILKSVRDGILDGYRFNCENIDIADLVYSDSFQKYFLNGGKIEWGKVKKSPFNGELVVLGKLIGNNYYDINIALESKENPFGYSKISHFNFFKKFDWVESKKSARKNLKESLNSDIKNMVNRIVDDLIGEYTPREWDSFSDNEKFNIIRIKYSMYEGKSKYLSEVRDLVIENMNHPFNVVFESKKSTRKSLKEKKFNPNDYFYELWELNGKRYKDWTVFEWKDIEDDFFKAYATWGKTFFNMYSGNGDSNSLVNDGKLMSVLDKNGVQITGKELNEIAYELNELIRNYKKTESKKSVRKSMKESNASLHKGNVEYGVERIRNKVKGSDVTYYFDDEDCFIDVTEKNGNLWAFTIDFGSGYVYMIEPKEDRGSFGADNEAFDVIISMLQGKRFNEKKSLKEQFVGKGEGGYKKPRANKSNSGICEDSNGINHKVIFDTRVEDFIVWVDNDNYLMWDIYNAKGLKRNLLKSDLDEKLIDEIAELSKQLIHGFDRDF